MMAITELTKSLSPSTNQVFLVRLWREDYHFKSSQRIILPAGKLSPVSPHQ